MDNFEENLIEATRNVAEHYFTTKIIRSNGAIKSVYRERIYCYELYHQIRVLWQPGRDIVFQAEYDKSGSNFYSGTQLKGVKPDFLIHTPGSSENNFIAMEVKPSSASNYAIKKDIEKIMMLMNEYGFKFGVYLIYGNNAKAKGNIAMKCINKELKCNIKIFTHEKANEGAKLIEA